MRTSVIGDLGDRLSRVESAIRLVRPYTQNEYRNTQLRDVPEMDQTCFGDRFLLRSIRTYIPEANATLAVVGHHPHQKRERHKHEGHTPILNGSAPRTRSTRSTDTCKHARYKRALCVPGPGGLGPPTPSHHRCRHPRTDIKS